MIIQLFNNWKNNKEFIFLEVSYKNEDESIFTFALLGFGLVLVIV